MKQRYESPKIVMLEVPDLICTSLQMAKDGYGDEIPWII